MKIVDRVVSLLAFLVATCQMQAQQTETVVLKDGSTLQGYTKQKTPQKNIIFSCRVLTAVLTENSVEQIVDLDTSSPDEMLLEWKDWAKNNSSLLIRQEGDGKKVIKLSRIELKKNRAGNAGDVATDGGKTSGMKTDILKDALSPESVFVIERGARIIYVDVKPHDYTIAYSDIDEIRVSPMPDGVISGLVSQITTKDDRKIEGQIVLHKIGKYETVLKDNGERESVPLKDIKSIVTSKLDTQLNLFEQSEYLDEVRVKNENGLSVEYKGVIVSQVIGNKKSECFTTIQTDKSETVQPIKVATENIRSIERRKNDSYRCLTDIIVKNDSFYVNRVPLTKFMILNDGKDEDMLYADVDTVITISPDEDNKVTFECSATEDNKRCKLVRVALELNEYVNKKSKRGNSSPYGTVLLSYKDLDEKVIYPCEDECTSKNNTLKHVYNLDKGTYMIYRRDKQCALFEIK